ncbi:MAG: hypothetical protein M3135_01055 [Actinomycetota bacterium]|nr:hypothetical protein [Actinomycetota bacterium]
MERERQRSGLWRGLILIIAGSVIAAALSGMSAGAPKPLTKKKADRRYVNVGEKANDADKLDGQDSSAFLTDFGMAGTSVKRDPSGETLDGTGEVVVDLQSLHDGGGDQRLNLTEPSRIFGSAIANIVTNSATASSAYCELRLDGAADSMGFDGGMNYPGTSGFNLAVPAVGSAPASAGAHNVDLFCNAPSGDVTFDNGTLAVWAIPA